MIETAYKFKPSGQEGPKQARQYTKPETPLEKALEKYLTRWPAIHNPSSVTYPADCYARARYLLENMDIDITREELAMLAVPFKNHPNAQEAGYFLSAAYNISKENEFVFEENGFRTRELGSSLNESKKLLIRGSVNVAAAHNKGIIINYGDCKIFPKKSYAPAINFGTIQKAGDCLNMIINFGDISIISPKSRNVINCGTVRRGFYPSKNKIKNTPGLSEFLDELKDQIGPHRSNEEIFAALRNRDIDPELTDILARGGITW